MIKKFKADEKALNELKEQVYIQQAREIEKVYEGLADAIESDIKIKGEGYTEQDLKLLQKEIEIQLRETREKIESIINNNIAKICGVIAIPHKNMLKAVDKKYKTNLSEKYEKDIKIDKTIKKVVDGKIYKDSIKLSKRIWKSSQKQIKDIKAILREGVKNKTNPYLIAKDLEKYVRPSAKKDWKWSQVYPSTSKRVDYNTQRLARTTLTHAYQEAYKESVRANPFIEYIEYNASHNARVCGLCSARDGKRFKIDDVPYDHPNGNCYLTSYIPENINDLIADYINKNY